MNPHASVVPSTRRHCLSGRLRLLLLLLVVIASAAITPAYAQSGDALAANIPFSFHAGELQFAPGQYTIEGATTWSMILRDARGEGQILAMSSLLALAPDRRLREPKLVFHRQGAQYFLAEIWTVKRGQKLASSSAEAMATTPPVDVAVVARRLH